MAGLGAGLLGAERPKTPAPEAEAEAENGTPKGDDAA
jgi:hypothetical protein